MLTNSSFPPSDYAKLTRKFAREMAEKSTSSPDDANSGSQTSWKTVWRAFADFGLLKLGADERFGGIQAPAQTILECLQALGHSYPDNGLTMGLCSQIWTVQEPLKVFGTDAQQQAFLPDLLSGKHFGAYALTERDSGSDAMRLSTRAKRRGDGYVLKGAKTLIGMAPTCDMALVFASTAPERGAWGISAFLVRADDPGFSVGVTQNKIGLRTLPMGELAFDDCYVHENRRLGPEGSGARIFQATMDWERSFILAPHVGAMARQLEDCARFAHDRKVFDQKIFDFQSVSNRLADMRLRLETSQLMLEKAARLRDKGQSDMQFAAMVNLHISEAFLASSIDALRIGGGAGYLAGASAGTDVTDALGGVIYSGTSDVQRQVIAKLLSAKGTSN